MSAYSEFDYLVMQARPPRIRHLYRLPNNPSGAVLRRWCGLCISSGLPVTVYLLSVACAGFMSEMGLMVQCDSWKHGIHGDTRLDLEGCSVAPPRQGAGGYDILLA